MHSGDSACVIPPLSIGPELEAEIRRQTELLVRGLGVQGLCNVQFALHEGTIYVLEANPRASRTVPFVCKAMGIDLVDLACRVTTGSRLARDERRHPRAARGRGQGGRAAVRALPGLGSRARPGDALDRRGHGARAGLRHDLRQGHAGRGAAPARRGPNGHRAVAFLSVCDRDKPAATLLAQRLADLGFDLVATPGTARRIKQLGIEVTEVAKVGEADGNSVVDLVRSGQGRSDRQHAGRPRRARRRLPDPPRRDLGQGPVHHDARRRQRGRAGDRARLGGRAQEPAGAARLTLSRVAACEPLGPYVQVQLERTFPAGEPGQFHMLRPLAHDGLLARPLSAVASDDASVTFLCQPARPARSRRSREVGAEVDVLGPVRPRLRRRRRRAGAAARGRRLRRRAARAALAAPAGGRAARGLPRRRCRARRRARAGGRARDRAAARQRARAAGAAARGCQRASSPPGPTGSCARSPRPARRRSVPCQVALEAPMACGYGACYGCAVRLGGRLVRLCVEGPVVAGARVAAA